MRPSTSKSKTAGKNPPGCLGIGVCLFSSIFIIVGLWATFSSLKSLTWKEVPCEFETFELSHNVAEEEPFLATAKYHYSWEGKKFSGTSISGDNDERNDNYEDLVELRFKLTERGTCFLDKNNPENSILTRSSWQILFGLFFAAVGSLFFLIGLSLFKVRGQKNKSLSSKGKQSFDLKGGFAGYLFFGLFALVGTGILIGLVIPTAKKYFSAKSWTETEATVIWSKVHSQSSDDGTTYRPDIFYRYQFEGQSHLSNNFSLTRSSSSGYESKKAIVDAHPRNHRFSCYVNPKKPWQSVVKRKLGWSALFGLFPLPFMAIGYGGLWSLLFRANKDKPKSSSSDRSYQPSHLSSSGKKKTPNKSSGRWGKFFGHLFFALFWCGITSVFVVIAWKNWISGNPEWFLIIFIIPFVLVGLGSLLSLPYTLLAIFSPRFDYEFEKDEFQPGLATKFQWKQNGGSGRLTSLNVTLVGQEQATYKQGTNTSTSTSTFYQKEIFQSVRLSEMTANSCDLILPADALPTLQGKNNRIIWTLNFEGKVNKRPKVKESLPLTLNPLSETDFQ